VGENEFKWRPQKGRSYTVTLNIAFLSAVVTAHRIRFCVFDQIFSFARTKSEIATEEFAEDLYEATFVAVNADATNKISVILIQIFDRFRHPMKDIQFLSYNHNIKQKIEAFCDDKRNTTSAWYFAEEKLKQLQN
jgi:hypothetical protein